MLMRVNYRLKYMMIIEVNTIDYQNNGFPVLHSSSVSIMPLPLANSCATIPATPIIIRLEVLVIRTSEYLSWQAYKNYDE